MSPAEMAACRASLGALQWVATQTQLQICARVNLLLTELTVLKTLQVAKEIRDLIIEVRREPTTLRMWRLDDVEHWQDTTVVTLADQAHANRPKGDSTGGLITCLGGKAQNKGEPGRLNVVAWRTWRLRRKAISTNDWCQLNGCCALPPGDQLARANFMMKFLNGIVATDSKVASTRSEGPMLGLSNARSALQAYQLREQLQESLCRLIWISGDWNLSDALTKKPKAAREGLNQFLKSCIWRLRYDPQFIQSEKRARQQGKSAVAQMRELQCLCPGYLPDTFEGMMLDALEDTEGEAP